MHTTLLNMDKFKKPFKFGLPPKTGLYDPQFEKDSCGVGLVANIKGIPSREIMDDAFHINSRMDHRGGCGFEENTGDGAGILMAIPDNFFQLEAKKLGLNLPKQGSYAVGNIFLPQNKKERNFCIREIEKSVIHQGLDLIGWRDVPTNPSKADVGPAALDAQPYISQLLVGNSKDINQDDFEREVYLIRKRFTSLLRNNMDLEERKLLYACSLSSTVMAYKGMLTPAQLFPFYPDLEHENFQTHLAMVHSRFSTNTFPSWDRAQPNRYMCHNGEINTLKGNMNAMLSRQGLAESDFYKERLTDLFPVSEPDCTDSGSFDNVLEFLILNGRSLKESIMMMIPEAWQSDVNMSEEKKSFYEFSSSVMEPWDGPASIVFTDGKCVGAVLDRNGLRPSRYYVTKTDKVIMASEVGVLKVDPKEVLEKGRLQPGKMFLIDFEEGRMIPDEEIKTEICQSNPYKKWVEEQVVDLEKINNIDASENINPDLIPRMQAFGYTTETMQFMLLPLVTELRDPLGSMGNDAALACLSDKPRLLYDYFKQLFAQVTNPAIDSIREEVIMSLECLIGPESNLLDSKAENAHRLRVKNPILSDSDLMAIKDMNTHGWKTKVIDITYEKDSGSEGMASKLDQICLDSENACDEGYGFIVLSDRLVDKNRIALSTLLACSTVNNHLINNQKRKRVGIILESGEAREVHHHCLLFGYGADAINPYLAFEAIWQAKIDGLLEKSDITSYTSMIDAYKKGVKKGIMKVMAKIGISTLHSYKGAQIFEAVGLSDEIINKSFPGTASRVQGINFEGLTKEIERRHDLGYPIDYEGKLSVLPNPGDFHWRNGGDSHMWDPKTISSLQLAARTNNEDAYWEFAKHANEITTKNSTLRGLLNFKNINKAIDIEEVESEKEIVKRFATGAMSLGSISTESHESLAFAMNQLGGKSNTGEGGEDPIRFKTLEDGSSKGLQSSKLPLEDLE